MIIYYHTLSQFSLLISVKLFLIRKMISIISILFINFKFLMNFIGDVFSSKPTTFTGTFAEWEKALVQETERWNSLRLNNRFENIFKVLIDLQNW